MRDRAFRTAWGRECEVDSPIGYMEKGIQNSRGAQVI